MAGLASKSTARATRPKLSPRRATALAQQRPNLIAMGKKAESGLGWFPGPYLFSWGVNPTDPPITGMAEEQLDELLAELSLCHLVPALAARSCEQLVQTLRARGRPALLEELKTAGVARLPERQKLASALAKQVRQASLPPRQPRPPRALHPPPPGARDRLHVEWVDGAWASGDGDHLGGGHAMPPIIVMDNVLTQTECLALVKRAEEVGFVASTHQGVRDEGFRRGGRAPLTDGGLAAEIFARISRALPRTPHAASQSEASQWAAPAGIWEQLRVLSYDAHDFFLPHFDNACAVGHSSVLPKCRSFYSLLLYLTDSDDGGGATRFYSNDASTTAPALQHDDVDSAASASGSQLTELHNAPAGSASVSDDGGATLDPRWAGAMRPAQGMVADVVPWAGRAVIFPHRMLHESMPICKGRKIVVRGDVLYGPTPASATASDHEDARAPASEPIGVTSTPNPVVAVT